MLWNRHVVICEPQGAVSNVGPSNNVTVIFRVIAASARAMPILPDERFAMNRTSSIGSWVAPAVMSTRCAVAWAAFMVLSG